MAKRSDYNLNVIWGVADTKSELNKKVVPRKTYMNIFYVAVEVRIILCLFLKGKKDEMNLKYISVDSLESLDSNKEKIYFRLDVEFALCMLNTSYVMWHLDAFYYKFIIEMFSNTNLFHFHSLRHKKILMCLNIYSCKIEIFSMTMRDEWGNHGRVRWAMLEKGKM